MDRITHPYFVADDTYGNKKDTAIALVGTARENGLTVRHHIATTMGGHWITERLADLVFDEEPEGDPEPEPDGEQVPEEPPAKTKTSTKTSGNRAAKNVSQEGE